MGHETETGRSNVSKGDQHRGKFTEGLLDTERILKVLNIRPGQTILDAGCGTGYMSKLFSDRASQLGKVYALDTDKYFIEVLTKETQGTNIEAVEGDISGPTRLRESSIDLIYISAVIHSFSREKINGFLQEAQRILKPGALLAVVEFEKKETPHGPPLQFRYSPEELKELIPLIPVKTLKVSEHFYMQVFQVPLVLSEI